MSEFCYEYEELEVEDFYDEAEWTEWHRICMGILEEL